MSNEDIFVREFVLIFGFLGGLFARVGVDPEEEILWGLLKALEALSPSIGPLIPFLLILVSIFSIIVSILVIYNTGGALGLMAVGLAWLSGFIIISGEMLTVIEVFLLLGALVIGCLFCEKH